jgi:hypothetical protein
MAFSGKNILLAGFTTLLLALPPLYALARLDNSAASEPTTVLARYLGLLYARDFRQAYRFISSEDQRLKRQDVYVRERGPFSGFTQDAARELAELIEIRTIAEQSDGTLNRIRVALKLPDAGAIAPLLHDWDETRLNALSMPERKKILAKIDDLAQHNKLPMINGEEEFVLVKEGAQWKVFLNWAAGIQVNFATNLPGNGNGAIAAEPVTKGTVARSGDVFIVGFKVKNLADHEIRTRIAHRIEPKELAEYLDLVECALLLPVRIRPGEEQIYNSTYVVRGDLPDGIKALNVTYDFKIEG